MESTQELEQTVTSTPSSPAATPSEASVQSRTTPTGKKPRSEAQIATTKKMQEKRKQKLELGATVNPDNLALADVWYSNHKMVKDERAKKKLEALEKLMENKLETYHSQLMENLAKPVANFFQNFESDGEEGEDEVEEEDFKPISPRKKIAKTSQQQQRTSSDEENSFFTSKSKRHSKKTNTSADDGRVDWSRFF